jgi:hypothetical protein
MIRVIRITFVLPPSPPREENENVALWTIFENTWFLSVLSRLLSFVTQYINSCLDSDPRWFRASLDYVLDTPIRGKYD